ncbi:MAG: hypothetical protein RIF36_18850 [Imperialibacter sp.]|uniref:hypothetical protein n=1 Tax=Imperialibacter sp. TaxID=2038411 RepID=UPI0032EFF19A|tara:strand:+ start:242 stop:592 length:351 start_codon:yes stop_codon:yes gene_type:complete
MNFENLDSLYRSSPGAYRELLEFMYQEFEKAQSKITSSIEKGDSTAFSHLKHKIFSTLNTLEYVELMDALTQVTSFYEGDKSLSAKELTFRVSDLFQHLFHRLDDKIAELDELKVM